VFEAPRVHEAGFHRCDRDGTTRTPKLPVWAGVMSPNESFLQLSPRIRPPDRRRGEDV